MNFETKDIRNPMACSRRLEKSRRSLPRPIAQSESAKDSRNLPIPEKRDGLGCLVMDDPFAKLSREFNGREQHMRPALHGAIQGCS